MMNLTQFEASSWAFLNLLPEVNEASEQPVGMLDIWSQEIKGTRHMM